MRTRATVIGVLSLALSAGCGSHVPTAAPTLTPTPTATAAPPLPARSPAPRPTPTPRVHAQAQANPVVLQRYADCSDMLGRIKGEALKEVTPWGLAFGGVAHPGIAGPMAAAAPGSMDATASAAAPAASTTNNQEAGVDEPDVAKTDGTRLVVVRHQPQGLQVVDVRTEQPRLRGFLGLPQVGGDLQLLLADRYVVAIGSKAPDARSRQASVQTEVAVVDVADLDHPRLVRSFTVDGWAVSSRYVDGRVLLVLQDSPRVVMTQPTEDTEAARSRALRENRRRIKASTIDRWLPAVTAEPSGRRTRSACSASYHSTADSGVSTTSVLALDPTQDRPGEMVSVVGNAQTVYASTQALYVTMTSWQSQRLMAMGAPSAERTQLHGFDITGRPSYLGSGSVPGSLTSQYALSEHEGYLRVATTVGRTMPPPNEGEAPAELSDNLVTVLRPEAGALVKVGQVRGLGRGERIYGVRFLGDLGYVVTFRQTDPLYVVDLHDPRHPVVRGELKVTGYSAYLHPIGDGLLVGLGQEVDARLRQTGTQASVFDVKDPRQPSLVSRLRFASSHSTAEFDPHAFLWWAPARLVVVPLERYAEGDTFNGVVVMHVSTSGAVRKVGRVEHPVADGGDPQPQDGGAPMSMSCCPGIVRSLVVGDLIFTVSEAGVMANAIDGLAEQAWLPFR